MAVSTSLRIAEIVEQLKSIDFIKTEGERRQMVYMLGDRYIQNNDIIEKAINIGLKTLKDNGEI